MKVTTRSPEVKMKQTFMNITAEKRNRVIKVSMEAFIEHGYENASTNYIVKTLGISKGSLFKYFETKYDLYVYLVHRVNDQLLDFIQNKMVINTSSWKERILHFAGVEFDFLIEHRRAYDFYHQMIKDLSHPELKQLKNELEMASSHYFNRIFEDLKLEDDFIHHLIFVVSGYNQLFIKKGTAFIEEDKKVYLKGLEVHLNYVRRH